MTPGGRAAAPERKPGRKAWRLAARVLAAVVLAVLAWGGYLAWRVWTVAAHDEARPADVIVVFGAAEYRGRPSPVLRARLDRALDLYRRGYAPLIITAGGAGGDPHFTEAGVGRDYLAGNGVPSENIHMEDQSSSTAETVLAVAEIMRRANLRTCVVASDEYHLFRIKRQFATMGVTAYGAPRERQVEMTMGMRVWVTIKQVAGYMLWRVGVRI